MCSVASGNNNNLVEVTRNQLTYSHPHFLNADETTLRAVDAKECKAGIALLNNHFLLLLALCQLYTNFPLQ